MERQKRFIDMDDTINDLRAYADRKHAAGHNDLANGILKAVSYIRNNMVRVDAVEFPCHCCDCYYLLNSKNSLGLYFFCGHQNGLKNLRNTEKDFCPHGKRRDEV